MFNQAQQAKSMREEKIGEVIHMIWLLNARIIVYVGVRISVNFQLHIDNLCTTQFYLLMTQCEGGAIWKHWGKRRKCW